MKINNTLAIVIDIQERMLPVIANKEEVERNSLILIKGLKALGVPLAITQQYTKGLGMSLPSIFEAAATDEYYEKMSFSALKDEETKVVIQSHNRKDVLVFGVEAHICVLQTCLDLKESGYRPLLVVDCIGSRKTSNLEMAIQRAIQEGITITSYEAILFELMERADIDAFKVISKLVR